MGIVKIFIENENIDVKSEIVDKYLMGVDENLRNNPSFISQLNDAIRTLTRRKNYSDRIPPLDLYIPDDGKSFEIRTPVIKDPDCLNDVLADNKHFRMTRFSLDEKTNGMDVTMFSGTLYRYDDFMKAHEGTEYGNKYKIFNSHDTPTVLSVYHRNKGFLESGVEVCESTYSDQYPLGMSMNDEQQLKTQIVYEHAPQKWNFNVMPDEARYEFNPQVSNAHRFINELGVVCLQTKSGKNAPVQAAEYACSTEYPERLASNPTPILRYEDGKAVVSDEYAKVFPDMSDRDIKKQVNISFAKGIETSRTKEYNPVMYENVKKLAQEGLQARYGISLESEELGEGIHR